jgi:hypothetical protein
VKPESGEAESSDAPSEMDAYELAEPVEVMSKIPESVYVDVVSPKHCLLSSTFVLNLLCIICSIELCKMEGKERGS